MWAHERILTIAAVVMSLVIARSSSAGEVPTLESLARVYGQGGSLRSDPMPSPKSELPPPAEAATPVDGLSSGTQAAPSPRELYQTAMGDAKAVQGIVDVDAELKARNDEMFRRTQRIRLLLQGKSPDGPNAGDPSPGGIAAAPTVTPVLPDPRAAQQPEERCQGPPPDDPSAFEARCNQSRTAAKDDEGVGSP